MGTLRVAVAQLRIALGQPKENISRARQLLSQTKQQGAELVLLPELWTTGYDLERAAEHGISLTSNSENKLSNLAREFEVYLCGSVLENNRGVFFNTQTIYSPAGKLVGLYRKLHLFKPLN